VVLQIDVWRSNTNDRSSMVHGSRLQDIISDESPTHGPFEHVRVFVCVPLPHDVLHSSSVHDDQIPA